MGYKKRLFYAGVFFFIIMSISGIYALNESIDDTDSPVSTSYVDISVFDNTTATINKIMPGDIVPIKIGVKNLGINCYIRTKINLIIKNENFIIDNYLDIDNSKWTKIGDYYYYKSVLNENSSVELFNKLLVPEYLNNNYENEDLIVEVIAEAIQTKNVNPNYSGDKPWGDVPINKKIDRAYSPNQINSSIIYENNANKYLKINRSFFNRLNNLVPGDVVSEYIDVGNIDKEVSLYYSLSSENMNSDEKKLFESFNLVIEDENNNILYNGAMLDYKKHFLKTYSKNAIGKLKMTVTMPTNLDNDYSLILTNIIWKFSVETTGEIPNNPRTGENNLNMSIRVFILSFIGLVVVLILAKINTIDRNKKRKR